MPTRKVIGLVLVALWQSPPPASPTDGSGYRRSRDYQRDSA